MEQQIQNELIDIGKRIRQLREYRKLTQIDLEISCGVGNAEISRIENGKKNVEVITLIKLAKSLNVATQEFFNYKGSLPK